MNPTEMLASLALVIAKQEAQINALQVELSKRPEPQP